MNDTTQNRRERDAVAERIVDGDCPAGDCNDCPVPDDTTLADCISHAAAVAQSAVESGAEPREQSIGAETAGEAAIMRNLPAPPARDSAKYLSEKTVRVGSHDFICRKRLDHGRPVFDIVRDERVVGIVKQLGSGRYRSLAWDRSTGAYTRLPKTRMIFESALCRIAIADPQTWR